MSWNYENYVTEQIHRAVVDLGIKDPEGNDYIFEVTTEQAFVKKKTLSPTTIYVVIKYLSSTNTLEAVMQPIQLLIFCEDNQIQASQMVFGYFVKENNFKADRYGTTYVKQDYREPVVLSNFNQTAYGYRTIMYISGTLFIMDDIMDVTNFTIAVGEGEAEEVKPINFNIAYSMTPNTQPIPPDKLATSVKSLATFAITFTVPMTAGYSFLSDIANIMSGGMSGNTDFVITFMLGSTPFGEFEDISGSVPLKMKLVSAQLTTAVDQIPGLQIGLIK